MNIKRNIIFAPESRKKDGIPVTKNVPIRMRVIFASQRWKIQCKLPPKTKRFCPLVLK